MNKIIEETKELIKIIGKKISWVGSLDGEFAITEEEFYNLDEVEYDAGYGAQHIASDLVVVFEDGSWLERGEYDGSEGWNYNKVPIKQHPTKSFKILGGNRYMWKSLKDINKGDINE